ncbi:MAG: polysaccharide biosynthesis protein [Candidatus Omnitrophica bacterium]|nr:polysaccharide biosynthesis protein [Candidatus Omnitrophota bacterium]
MSDFAFIFHPHDIESLGDWVLEEPRLKQKRRRFVERALRWLPPVKRETVTGIESLTGKEIKGDMILWPMIPEQIINMRSDFTISKLIEAGRLAQQLGARIIGLGAYAAWIGKRGVLLAEAVNVPVTTGTNYTILVAIEAALSALNAVGINISEASVSVIGATGSIGEICTRILAKDVGQLILVARNEEKLHKLAGSLREAGSTNVTCTNSINNAVSKADLILIATSAPTALVSIDDIKPGSVVCDISLPHNILKDEAEKKTDILVIDGGVVKPPGNVDFHFCFGLEKGLAYACMAETMMLALEELYVSYSIGGNISILKVAKMAQLAKKHGFKLAEFTSFGKTVPKERIKAVAEARLAQPTHSPCPLTLSRPS